jgi:hypothetical protein
MGFFPPIPFYQKHNDEHIKVFNTRNNAAHIEGTQ